MRLALGGNAGGAKSFSQTLAANRKVVIASEDFVEFVVGQAGIDCAGESDDLVPHLRAYLIRRSSSYIAVPHE
jgi:hypothetical protein